ncbi:PQQ-binding-like beta-propeller repeat protein [Cellulomonas sp. H30R-01]|uniref:outer membrane protein assembly factor BamB family protein n=1 Tax=Cellulomonas sp. H30R-01 TaxID=2704467 RepID=UPI00138D29FE|nr:PQQ-binding-like beta-propeller repeat protein [Cellulomonas sp. H30R-01]QHT57626.1 PQQ-binding-like beta-propeller repeat protein [Cellulomonas sp. H30R-01]
MARGERLSFVELVEDDDHDVAAPTPGAPTAEVVRARRWRRPATVVGAVVAVVVLALVAVQSVVDARARGVDARIAALPGALADVGDTLEPLWSPDDAWWPTATSGGAAFGMTIARDGTAALVARDVETGEERWSTAVSPEVAGAQPTDARCAPPEGEGAPEPTTMVCFVTDALDSTGSIDPDAAPRPGTWSRVTVVDLRDGTVVAAHDLDEPALHAAVLREVVALLRVDAAGHVEVTAVDPVSGDEAWRYRHPTVLPGARDDRWSYVTESAGHVVVQTPLQVLVLDPTGRLREDLRGAETWAGPFLQAPRDGRTLVVRAGRPDLEVLGDFAVRQLDDGSLPGLELSSSGGHVYGWDAETGGQRWEVVLDTGPIWSALVVDGRVHLATRTGVAALSGRTGEVLWTYELAPGSTPSQVLTDGPHVLVEQVDPRGVDGSVLVVLDRRTGVHVRDLSMPTGVQGVVPFGHRLLAFASEPVVLG